jgi:hypothetical protein
MSLHNTIVKIEKPHKKNCSFTNAHTMATHTIIVLTLIFSTSLTQKPTALIKSNNM